MKTHRNKSPLKISKGYRLQRSTHELIDKVKNVLKVSKDDVISNAVRKYFNSIKYKREQSKRKFISKLK